MGLEGRVHNKCRTSSRAREGGRAVRCKGFDGVLAVMSEPLCHLCRILKHSNSEHDLLSLQDTSQFCEVVSAFINVRALEHLFCFLKKLKA